VQRVVKWNAILQQCRVLKRALKGAGPAEHGHGDIPAATPFAPKSKPAMAGNVMRVSRCGALLHKARHRA